jgi:hypothetical protein
MKRTVRSGARGGSTGASAEREERFGPQPKAELAQGEYKGAREVTGTTRPHRPAVGWPGRGGGAKDLTGDPAGLYLQLLF